MQINRDILRLALPSIVSNITVPLLGLVDLAVVGHIGDARMIGAIAVGSMMFNLIYWVFGFLRMGTSGLTAQAYGAKQTDEIRSILFSSVKIGLIVALMMIACQRYLLKLAMVTISPDKEVIDLVTTYYNICIWGAPAVLVGNGLIGWFIGMQNTRTPMIIAIVQNVSNIVLSLILVFVFKMQLSGVALGTTLAQYLGVAIAFACLPRYLPNRQSTEVANGNHKLLLKMITNNGAIFLRTLCLVAVNLFFLSMGARGGATILAVNSILMEFYILFSFILDGFAFAGEALGGRFWGAKDEEAFGKVVRNLFVWGVFITLVFTLFYVVGGDFIVGMLTTDVEVVSLSYEYIAWTWLIPIAGMAAFVWDGIYIGITATGRMLLSAVVAMILFFAVDLLLHDNYANHALWMAFLVFLAMRGIVQTIMYRGIKKSFGK